MIAIPALDLREGASVQLVGGDYGQERVRDPDPLATLRRWESFGFTRVHMVDLDAATGRGSNATLIHSLIGSTGMDVQLGGGLRDDAHLADAFASGARYAVLGTRALEDPAWLRRMCQVYPKRIIVAADVRGRALVSRGWQRSLERDVLVAITELNALPLAAVLVTAVHNEGRLDGTDHALFREVCRVATSPIQAAGGITSRADLAALADCGVSAVIIGMALHAGVLDPTAVAEEFAI